MNSINSKFLLLVLIIGYLTYFSSALRIKSSHYKKASEDGFTGDPKKLFNYTDFFLKSLQREKTETNDISQIQYGGWFIHDIMLKDKRRTLTLKEAIFKNSEVFKDKIVLEVGAGSGVLSMFAAQAGARHVYGFEFSDFAEIAMKNVADNGLTDKVTIIKKKVEEGELPVDKVDIIISEWMDTLLIGENMFGAVIYARDKWLKKDGLVLPDRGELKLAALHSKKITNFVDFYNDVYGLKMPVIKQMIKSNDVSMVIEPEAVVSSAQTIYEFDIYKMKMEDINIVSAYSLSFPKDTLVTALGFWWSVEFNLPHKIVLSTDPKFKATHWKQDVVFLDNPIQVAKGETLNGSISIVPTDDIFKRSMEVKFSCHYNGKFGKVNSIQQKINDGSDVAGYA